MSAPSVSLPSLPMVSSPGPPGVERSTLPALADLDQPALERLLGELGEPPYRARQVGHAFWQGSGLSWEDVSTLPASLRKSLAEAVRWSTLEVAARVVGDAGATLKAGLRVDAGVVEAVLMRYPGREGSRARSTVCISSQLGCAVGCPFCATGDMGFLRNLKAAEIVDQVLWAAREELAEGRHLSNVVYMGMGEPLANYAAVLSSLRALTDPARLGLSPRSITVSTCGLVPQIRALADEDLGVGLAISLHAPDDKLRDRMVPVNRKWPLEQLLDAGAYYAQRTGRRVTYEYIVLPEQNDSLTQAQALARAVLPQRAHVNLIPANLTGGVAARPSGNRLRRFSGWLRQAGVNATIRANRGTDVMAACGQLSTHLATQEAGA